MDLEKVALIASMSRYECEIQKYGGEEKAKENYLPERWQEWKDGHVDQKKNLARITPYFPSEQIIFDRINFTPAFVDKYDGFVFLGGDNHFTYCSQVMLQYLRENPDKKKAVIGTVLDPKRSVGGMLNFTVDDWIDFIPELRKDRFGIELWTALDTVVKIGSKTTSLYPAINEVATGETKFWNMSRNYIFLDGQRIFPDKSSGILVVTGAASGNGSWYDNVHWVAFQQADVFPPTAPYARIFLREHKSRSKATLEKGQVLTIHSSNDNLGFILPDSHEEHGVLFPMGAAAEIKISSVHLPVVSKK